MVSASLESVENVVKPPHSPTVRNRPQDVVSVALRLSNPFHALIPNYINNG